jgi:co-chaperonin GroES (HSP10)
MLIPIGKNVLVKIKPPEKKSTLILTSTNDEPFQAEVLDIGSRAEIDIEIGDVLLLVPYCGSKISKEDDGYLLVTERDILGVVNG